jgi:hypothetical protein
VRHDIRRADTHHRAEGGWFDAEWHFSFGGWHDPERLGVGPLRVFNDDRIVPGALWPMHPHADIESLTWVVEGDFSHADSLGNGGDLRAGAAQVMRFSHQGAQHSERNGSDDERLRFLQFWILPSQEGLDNDVQQRQWEVDDRTDQWLRIMSHDRGDGALDLAQDATVDVARLTAGHELQHTFGGGRGGYLYVIDGAVDLGGSDRLTAGDALAVSEPSVLPNALTITAREPSEVILVDVPLVWEPVGIWAGRR